MNQDEIIRMAREAGFTNPRRFQTNDENLKGILADFWENLERFAQMVASREREACIAIVRHYERIDNYADPITDAIRARGEA